ncbi:MAG: DUF6484 domain-containing protein [bacterium]
MRTELDGIAEMVLVEDIHPGTIQGVRVGKLVCLNEAGEPLVDYPDNPKGPVPARSTVAIPDSGGKRMVLLLFEHNDPHLPIIIGFIQDQPVVAASFEKMTEEMTEEVTEKMAGKVTGEVMLERERIKDIIIDGERIVFEAGKEIVLRCGKGSITLRKDGKVVIKGTDLVSRSKGINKIKGAAVRIN